MSDERSEKIGSQGPDAGAKAAKKKVKRKNLLTKWFREMRSELKKVIWPTPKQIVNNTLVAMTVMVSSSIVIWAVDQIGGQIFQAIRLLGGG